MGHVQEVTIIFADEQAINVSDFIEWMRMFRAAYEANKNRSQGDFASAADIQSILENDRELITDLAIVQLSKSSPMEIVCLGMSAALTAAVVFSGGKIEASGVKFELPPLGEGVKSMRIALEKDVKSESNYQPKDPGD